MGWSNIPPGVTALVVVTDSVNMLVTSEPTVVICPKNAPASPKVEVVEGVELVVVARVTVTDVAANLPPNMGGATTGSEDTIDCNDNPSPAPAPMASAAGMFVWPKPVVELTPNPVNEDATVDTGVDRVAAVIVMVVVAAVLPLVPMEMDDGTRNKPLLTVVVRPNNTSES